MEELRACGVVGVGGGLGTLGATRALVALAHPKARTSAVACSCGVIKGLPAERGPIADMLRATRDAAAAALASGASCFCCRGCDATVTAERFVAWQSEPRGSTGAPVLVLPRPRRMRVQCEGRLSCSTAPGPVRHRCETALYFSA